MRNTRGEGNAVLTCLALLLVMFDSSGFPEDELSCGGNFLCSLHERGTYAKAIQSSPSHLISLDTLLNNSFK